MESIATRHLKNKYNKLVEQAWLVGELSYKYHAGQLKIRDEIKNGNEKLHIVNVSRQSGKTFLEAVMACETSRKKKNARIKIGTAYLSDLEEFVLPAFDTVLADCPASLRPKYNVQKSKFIFPQTGAEVKLVGLDRKPDGLRGSVTDLVMIDEAGYLSDLEYQYKSVIVPSTTHRPNAKIIFFSTPPESLDHPFAIYCEQQKLTGNYSHATIYDNPMLTKKQIDDIIKIYGGVDSIEFRREYLAELIVNKTKAIVPEWNDSFVQEMPDDYFTPFYHRYTAMDLGVRDFTAFLFGYYNFSTGQLHIQDEMQLHGEGVRTDNIKNVVIEKEKEHFGGIKPRLRISDNNNLMLLQDLVTDHKISFIPTSKDNLHAMVNELRVWTKQGRIIIHPRCKMLIGNMNNALWNKTREEFTRSEVYKHWDHLATLIYLVRNIDQQTNPIPATHGMSRGTHFIKKDFGEQKNFAELKKVFNLKR